ncbi:SH3 domain-containing protein [Amaricoccus sp.]|uniref:SH3 domain-containing protein n=1 Tax=Amaricoccus sp. TaxID=1872485 RepID=UPI001B563CB7|nr:SH3 domain-containing protein [Amaricoccus sp.]MBP7242824.1 aspartyl-trna synthetase [Amaricoccus sp.]
MVLSTVRRAGVAVVLLLTAGLVPAAPALAVADADPADAAADPAVGPVTGMAIPRFVSMRAESANARRGPSLDHKVDWTFVRRGMPLEVTGEYGNWRRVRDAEGAGGWVHHTLLSGIRTALVGGDAPSALRAEPDDAAAIRAFVEPGVVARLEHCRGDWCELSVDGVGGWAHRAGLWGVFPGETIE